MMMPAMSSILAGAEWSFPGFKMGLTCLVRQDPGEVGMLRQSLTHGCGWARALHSSQVPLRSW